MFLYVPMALGAGLAGYLIYSAGWDAAQKDAHRRRCREKLYKMGITWTN